VGWRWTQSEIDARTVIRGDYWYMIKTMYPILLTRISRADGSSVGNLGAKRDGYVLYSQIRSWMRLTYFTVSPWVYSARTSSNKVDLRGLWGVWASAGKAPAEVTSYYHFGNWRLQRNWPWQKNRPCIFFFDSRATLFWVSENLITSKNQQKTRKSDVNLLLPCFELMIKFGALELEELPVFREYNWWTWTGESSYTNNNQHNWAEGYGTLAVA
jgi:hypothetical protein